MPRGRPKGSGIPSVNNHLRIPDKLYQKIVESKEQTKSINKRVIDLLTKGLEAEEAQLKRVV